MCPRAQTDLCVSGRLPGSAVIVDCSSCTSRPPSHAFFHAPPASSRQSRLPRCNSCPAPAPDLTQSTRPVHTPYPGAPTKGTRADRPILTLPPCCRQLNLLITLLNLLAIMYSRPAAATSTPGPEGQAVPPTAAGQASPGSAPTQPPQQPPQQPPLQPVAPQGVPQPPAQPPSMPAGQVTVAASPSPAPDRALAQSPGLAVLPSPAGQAGPQAVIHGMDPGAPEQP